MLLPDARTGMRVKTRELRRCWLLLCSLTCASLIAVFYRARRATWSQQRQPGQVPKNTVQLKTLLKSLKVPIELRVCAIQCNRPRCPRSWGESGAQYEVDRLHGVTPRRKSERAEGISPHSQRQYEKRAQA